MCLRLNFNIYSLRVHKLPSLSLSRSLISSLNWFAMNSCSFFLLITSSNSIGKYILHAPLTSLVAALDSFNHTVLGSAFGVLGNLWSQHDVIRSWLRLTATSNYFPHPFQKFTKCLNILICCPQAYSSSLAKLSSLLGSDLGVLGHLWS